MSGNFYNATMRNLFTTMPIMMCHAGFHADVAMLILLASVIVMDVCKLNIVFFCSSNSPFVKNIIAYVLSKCENLVGAMVFGREAADNILPWLRTNFS